MAYRGRVLRRSVSKQLEAPLDKITIDRVKKYLVSIGESADKEVIEELRSRIAELDEENRTLAEDNRRKDETIADFNLWFPDMKVAIHGIRFNGVVREFKDFVPATGNVEVPVNGVVLGYFAVSNEIGVVCVWNSGSSPKTMLMPAELLSVSPKYFLGDGISVVSAVYTAQMTSLGVRLLVRVPDFEVDEWNMAPLVTVQDYGARAFTIVE